MPDTGSGTVTAATPGPPPAIHLMDPRRGENLSPMFGAVLCYLLQLPPMTTPSITGIAVSGGCVFAATSQAPFHDTLLGAWSDVCRNLRDWGDVCGAEPATVDGLIAKLRRAGA